MLETVSKGFRSASQRFRGQRELTEANVSDAIREVRVSLLEADVEFNVVKRFLKRVEEACLGDVVDLKVKHQGKTVEVSPGDHFTKVCHDELEALMGPVDSSIQMATQGPTRVMMVGLQGAGKTTTTGKLAKLIEAEYGKCCLVAADIYRPAAVDQLRVGTGWECRFTIGGASPAEICSEAISSLKITCDLPIPRAAYRRTVDAGTGGDSHQHSTGECVSCPRCHDWSGRGETAAEFNRRLETELSPRWTGMRAGRPFRSRK